MGHPSSFHPLEWPTAHGYSVEDHVPGQPDEAVKALLQGLQRVCEIQPKNALKGTLFAHRDL
jgi:hypothetical protein